MRQCTLDRLKKKYGSYPLHKASGEKNSLQDVKVLLNECDLDVNETDQNRKTSIYYASYYENANIIQYLLSNGGREDDVRQGTKQGKLDRLKKKYDNNKYTMHIASGKKGNLRNVKIFIEEYDFNVNAEDGDGKTGMYLAAYNDNDKIVCL